MRTLLLLRGAHGCGKTTWISQNGLKQYTLSADDIRTLCSSPELLITGERKICQGTDTLVWSTLFKLLESRMNRGEFTVIDATNSKTSEMNRYKELCEKYRYRIFCVDFTDVPIEVAKKQNMMRPAEKHVPEEVIEKMYARFRTQRFPSGITVIKPHEIDKIWYKPTDLSMYKKIHCFGDIHGCYTPLKEYLDSNGGIKEDEFYVFCGDYIDRGLENVEVIKFLLSIYKLPNVYLIEGNHERSLWAWASGDISQSREFELVTKTQLENSDIDKKEVRRLYRKMCQCGYYTYGEDIYLVTHGGLSCMPENITTIATTQMIKGVGDYKESELADNAFLTNTLDNCYQIHGHRNIKGVPVRVNDRSYNLEGQVEFGGYLRCVQISEGGSRVTVETKNPKYRNPDTIIRNKSSNKEKTIGDIIIDLRNSKYIQEKPYGNISSFNFTKSAFYDKVWDSQTTKARGLYINIPKQKIVARAYDKFFNINEREETKLDSLRNTLSFPVTAYVKENGFLGIVSYNEEDDSLFITTKSSPDGPFAMWFKDVLKQTITKEKLQELKEYVKENNVSFVFECVDIENDPHIIEYPENKLYLLDIVYNDIKYSKYEFNQLCGVAEQFGLSHKEAAYVLTDWPEFFDWYCKVTEEDYKYHGKHIEGFVLEDNNGNMVKLKLAYYNFWKFMRGISHEVMRKGYVDKRRLSAMTSALANEYYGWIKALCESGSEDEIPRDIISLRNMFMKTRNNIV